MREIKFRAWNTTTKEWESDFSIEFEDDEVYTDPLPLKLQQYAGLKDKNGKEIYGGDILGKRPYGYLKSDGTKDGRYKGKEWDCFAVEWGEYDPSTQGMVSGYEYEIDGKYVGWNLTVGGYDDDTKLYEVIGNIYENPELLREKLLE